MASRKARHLEICLDSTKYDVEGEGAGYEAVRFYHTALPELHADQLDLTRQFLGREVKLPFFISSMTGGSEEAYRINKDLAAAAQRLGIAVGMGSNRIIFRKPEVFDHFYLRHLAPDVPIMSNMGAVQLLEMKAKDLNEMNKRLEVDAQIIHLNPGQELFQPGGDRDFSGLAEAIARFVEKSSVPVIVKETGFGIAPNEIRLLMDAGVAYVDLAGAGGTNWLTVESYRDDEEDFLAAEEFRDWGYPTAVLQAVIGNWNGRILASGGLRSGLDVAKSIALGAHLAGLAMPFARAVSSGGIEGVVKLGRRLEKVIRTAMVMTGSENLTQLGEQNLAFGLEFSHQVQGLKDAFGLI